MQTMSRSILVTGATGKQGGAVIQALLASPHRNNFTIYALTRSTTSPSAKRLAEKGGDNVKLIQGDLNNVDAIFKSAPEKFWGVFSVQVAIGKGGVAAEESQGKALVDAALAHGTSHFVYSSVDRGGAKAISNPTDVPHFISKHRIEHHLIDQTANNPDVNMGWTILRPVAFMDNFTDDFMGRVLPTAWRDVLGEKPLQLISAKDIGKFGAKAFLEPEAWNHKEIALAGDELSFSQMNSIFKERAGKDVPTTYGFLVKFILWMSKEFGNMMRWFKTDGYAADVEECRREVPELMDFKTWLEKESAWKKA